MKSETTAVMLAIVCTIWACAHAEPPDKRNTISVGGKDYLVAVTRIHEWRYPGKESGDCSFDVTCDLPASIWMATQLDIETALDDTGVNMVKEKTTRLKDSVTTSLLHSNTTISIRLKTSARDAKVIREVKGFVHLQKKGGSDASKVILRDFTARAGEYISSAELKKRGIDVAYINAETYDAKGGKLMADILDPPFTNQSDKVAAKIENPMKNAMAGIIKGLVAVPGTMVVIVKDPSAKVIKLEANDSRSGKTTVAQPSANGMYMIQTVDSLAADDKKPAVFDELHVYLNDEALTEKAPFSLNDIPLP